MLSTSDVGPAEEIWHGGTPINQLETVALSQGVAAGTFTLTFDYQTTTALSWDGSAAQVAAALARLSSIGAGNVDVTGPNGGPYEVTLAASLFQPEPPGTGWSLQGDASQLVGGSAALWLLAVGSLGKDEVQTAGFGTNRAENGSERFIK
ncbi:MAG: hypothetical protein ACREHD_13665 [Pirellulales bacterium]